MSDIGKRFPFDAYPKGWFQVAGSNAEIPYAKTVNRTARLRAWPTVERAGGIFVWHSEASTEPEWELPKIPELFGMGLDVVRHRGLGRSCTLLTVTPIDGELVDGRGEGAITEFRAWARQSYEEAYA